MRKERVLREISLGCGIAFLALFAVEGLIRLSVSKYWAQDSRYWIYSDQAGYHYKPGNYLQEDIVGFVGNVNSLGYRGDEWGPKTKPRIIMVGDSQVLGLKSNTSIPEELQKLLPEYEVLNAGLGANNSANVLWRIKNELMQFDPDIIVVGVGWNDIFVSDKTGQTLASKLIQKSYIVRGLVRFMFKTYPNLWLRDTLGHYKNNMMAIQEFCNDNNISVWFLGLNVNVDGSSLWDSESKIFLKNSLSKMNQSLSDTGRFITLNTGLSTTEEFGSDCIHRTDMGNMVVAKLLAKYLN